MNPTITIQVLATLVVLLTSTVAGLLGGIIMFAAGGTVQRSIFAGFGAFAGAVGVIASIWAVIF